MSPQAPGRTPSPDKLVPFRWPSAWTDPALLRLFEGSPINCLLFERPNGADAIAAAARGAGFAVLDWSALAAAPLAEIKWDSAEPRTAITGLVWPRIRMSTARSSDASAGPTGAPWIDSNAWVARLAAVRAPRRPVWLGFEIGKDDPVPGESGYTIAIADSAAARARWMVALDDGLAQALPAANANALKLWRGIVGALAFFEKQRGWDLWEPSGSVGILSSFDGRNEFMGQEVLNLAARRNLLYRVLHRSLAAQKLDGLRAILYVDGDAPSAAWKSRLAAFAQQGGLLIVPRALASQFAGGMPAECPVSGYELRPLGKGSVAAATRDWDDPYFLAADVHNLVGRRHDPVTLFNARSLWEHYSVAPGGHGALLQLVAFTGRPNESVSLAPARPWSSAALHTIGRDAPSILQPVRAEGRLEFHLPAFSYYAALEFRP